MRCDDGHGAGSGPPCEDDGVSRVYDDERLAGAYQFGNRMPQRSLLAWTQLIGSFHTRPGSAVLDMGAGTGMLSAAMARWLPVRAVIGVDPSVPMLTEARRAAAFPRVYYAAGAAEAIPARHQVFDLALLSRVIHHVNDRHACARELARVLRRGGTAVIRTTFRSNLDAPVYRYWPRLLEVDRDRFPGEDKVIGSFTAAGFSVTQLLSFAQPVTSTCVSTTRAWPPARSRSSPISPRPNSARGCSDWSAMPSPSRHHARSR